MTHEVVSPVYVDGPLAGQVFTVPERELIYGVRAASGTPMHPKAVQYYFHRIEVFGRIVIVGSVTEHPADADLFRYLVSDVARNAVMSS